MKKIFKIKLSDNGIYRGYQEDPLPLNADFEYELLRDTPLDIVWHILEGSGSIIPPSIFRLNPPDYNINTDTIKSVKIDDETLRLYNMDDNTKYIDIKFENLKKLWEKYVDLKEQGIKEIILARNGDYYFIES